MGWDGTALDGPCKYNWYTEPNTMTIHFFARRGFLPLLPRGRGLRERDEKGGGVFPASLHLRVVRGGCRSVSLRGVPARKFHTVRSPTPVAAGVGQGTCISNRGIRVTTGCPSSVTARKAPWATLSEAMTW